jgi:hypothetical protein
MLLVLPGLFNVDIIITKKLWMFVLALVVWTNVGFEHVKWKQMGLSTEYLMQQEALHSKIWWFLHSKQMHQIQINMMKVEEVGTSST